MANQTARAEAQPSNGDVAPGTSAATGHALEAIDKSELAHPEPRRVRDKDHLRFVSTQPCLICGRTPADPHHLRFAQSRALGRKVSDEWVVALCRGHHREFHRHGDEGDWWEKAGVDPNVAARSLWLQSHPSRSRSHKPLADGKASDEFVVPLCRVHHREVHRCGDETAWWRHRGIDALAVARALWLQFHSQVPNDRKVTL
jgi:hypothetical protein